MEHIKKLLELVEEDVGINGLCSDEPDSEPVATTGGPDGMARPVDMTFGHVRRARQELEKLMHSPDPRVYQAAREVVEASATLHRVGKSHLQLNVHRLQKALDNALPDTEVRTVSVCECGRIHSNTLVAFFTCECGKQPPLTFTAGSLKGYIADGIVLEDASDEHPNAVDQQLEMLVPEDYFFQDDVDIRLRHVLGVKETVEE